MPDIDNIDIYNLLLDICESFDIDPLSSIESETYFHDLLSSMPDEASDKIIREQIAEKISEDFVAVDKRPVWIQGPEWPIQDNSPMLFAGQIDISLENNDFASQFFHDDTAIYVFLSKKKGPPVVIIQQY